MKLKLFFLFLILSIFFSLSHGQNENVDLPSDGNSPGMIAIVSDHQVLWGFFFRLVVETV